MKKSIISIFLLAASLVAFANANQKAVEFYTFDVTSTAKKLFEQNLKSGTLTPQEQAEANFYLGEMAYREQDFEAAENFYKQGQAADPAYLFNAVGQTKLQLKTNKPAADKAFKTLLGKNKKNMPLQAAVARAYLDAGELYDANRIITAAKKVNDKYAPLYEVEGDIYAVKKEHAKALALYENAIYFDSQSTAAYIKYARAFTYLNPNAAIGKLKEYAAVNPNSALIHREIGEVYFKNERYAEAVKAYDIYKSKEKEAADDYKYALLLFMNNEFDKSMEIVQSGLKENPNNFDLKRISMYNYYKQGNYQDGAAYADKFMNDRRNAAQIIPLDHIYYARLLSGSKRQADALKQYETALQQDSNRVSLYKELGETNNLLGNYAAAVGNFKIYINKAKNQVTPMDYFNLGNANLYAATLDSLVKADPAKRQAFALAADSAFTVVAEKAPQSYLGNLGRARANQVLFPDTKDGKAKPFFEEVLALLKPENPADKAALIETYDYLGSYYYVMREMETSKSYWQKILELNPANEKATKVLSTIK